MLTTSNRTSYAQKPQLAAYSAARRFHETLLQWVPNAQAARSQIARLERRTHAAVAAIRVAVDSPSHRLHLARAKEHLLMCLAEFELLADEGRFPEELCRTAISRIDQILRAIDQLTVSSIDEWKNLELPPLIPVEPEDEEERKARELNVEQIADFDRAFAQRLRPVIRKRRPQARTKESIGSNGRHSQASK